MLNEHSTSIEAPSLRSNKALPTVTYARPRCPNCGHVHFKKHRSINDQGDGSALWWVSCRSEQCRHRFRVLLE